MKKIFILIITLIIIVIIGGFFIFQKSNLPKQEIETIKTKFGEKVDTLVADELVNICSMFSRKSAEIHKPIKPFSPDSIWNRLIPKNAVYENVQDAIFGNIAASTADFEARLNSEKTIRNLKDKEIKKIIEEWNKFVNIKNSPWRILPDIVTICYTDPTQPFTNIEQSSRWDYPDRARSTGKIQYQRNLSSASCGCVNWKKTGNNLVVLIDPIKKLADLLVGSWRIVNGPLLNLPNDGPLAHNIDVLNGQGIQGYGRGSGLPALGGLVRPGELKNGIEHAVGITMPAIRFSFKEKGYQWPAQSADSSANIAYWGKNPNYTMGALLAIPFSIDINKIKWNTTQGFNFARAAQNYGLYVIDSSSYFENIIGIAVEDETAYFDLGYNINPDTGDETIDPSKIDIDGFNADILQVFSIVSAVTSNIR